MESGNDDSSDVTPHQVVLRHRVRANRMVDLASSHLDALNIAVTHRDLFRRQILDRTATDPNGKRRAKLLKMISPGAQAATLNRLGKFFQDMIQLERQAYGLGPHELPPELVESAKASAPGPTGSADPAEWDAMLARARERFRACEEQKARGTNA